jgi:hypothetical protein
MTSTSAAAVALLAALALLSPGVVDAWGGLFNRFSPEILSNLGYGGRAGPYKPQPFLQVTNCAHSIFRIPSSIAAARLASMDGGCKGVSERPLLLPICENAADLLDRFRCNYFTIIGMLFFYLIIGEMAI